MIYGFLGCRNPNHPTSYWSSFQSRRPSRRFAPRILSGCRIRRLCSGNESAVHQFEHQVSSRCCYVLYFKLNATLISDRKGLDRVGVDEYVTVECGIRKEHLQKLPKTFFSITHNNICPHFKRHPLYFKMCKSVSRQILTCS